MDRFDRKHMTDTDLLDRVFGNQSTSGAWKMLRDWFLPRSNATQVKWSDAFDAVNMEKGEEPMKFFSRVDKIASTLASLGVPKSESDVNRKLVRVLMDDYEIEQRTLLYRDEITRAEIDNIARQRYLRLLVSKGKNVGQAPFSGGVTRGGRGVVVGVAVVVAADPTITMVGRGTRNRRMQELAKVAKVATIPPPTSKQSLKQSTIRCKASVSVAWNPGTCGTSARLESPRLQRRPLTGVHRDRTTAARE